MNINKHIVIATVGLMAIGLERHYQNPNIPLTPIFLGSFAVVLSLSVLDLFGGNASKIAGAIAMVALVNGILTELPADFLTQLTGTKFPKSAGGAGSKGVK